uniref:Uncharacterized protein n=1 Tax=Anopheles culicifacies TaxID=139723 RepID=A0A182M858_9DIPT
MSPLPPLHEDMEMRQCSEINKREHWRRKTDSNTGSGWPHGSAISRIDRLVSSVATVGLLWLAIIGCTLAVASSVHDGHCKHLHPKAHEAAQTVLEARGIVIVLNGLHRFHRFPVELYHNRRPVPKHIYHTVRSIKD